MTSREGRALTTWSFSALKDARECPRRRALRLARAESARGAAHKGASGVGALRGRVCHAVLERMLELHRARGGPAWGTRALSVFWSQHLPAGLTAAVRAAAEEELRGRGPLVRRELEEAIPSMAAMVRTLLRLAMSEDGVTRALAEVEVEAELAPGLRWRGRIDAILLSPSGVTIADFKTGTTDAGDLDQLTSYACALPLDPRTRHLGEAHKLAVLYAAGDTIERPAPRGAALVEERERLAAEVREAARRLGATPPVAAPERDRCSRCEVRGRCDAYWVERSAWGSDPLGTIDFEAIAGEVRGPCSIELSVDGAAWLLQAEPTHASALRVIPAGARVRVVGAASARRGDDDGWARVVTLGPNGVLLEVLRPGSSW